MINSEHDTFSCAIVNKEINLFARCFFDFFAFVIQLGAKLVSVHAMFSQSFSYSDFLMIGNEHS